MTTKSTVEDFIAQERLAVVGVSREGKKFGNMAYKELKEKGYKLYPVHPQVEVIEGDICYPSLSDLPEEVDGVLIVLPPSETEKVVVEAYHAGITRVWMQQGAESDAAIRYCEENGISVVHGECVLMFADPTAFHHRAHRWVWGVLGKLPE